MRPRPRVGRRPRPAPIPPTSATFFRAPRPRWGPLRRRAASPARSTALPGIHAPPRGDVLRPRRRRLASSSPAPRRAHGPPRERRQGSPAGAGGRPGYAAGVAAVQAAEGSQDRDQGTGLALGRVGYASGAAGCRRGHYETHRRAAVNRRERLGKAFSRSLVPVLHCASVRLCVCASVRLAVAAPVHYALFSLSSLGALTPGHQFHLPAMCMIAGTSTIRIKVASSKTAAARPKPMSWTASTRVNANVPNTRIMIRAALVMVDAVADRPSIVAWSFRPVLSKTSFTRVNKNTS